MVVMIPELAFKWIIPEIIISLCALFILILGAFSSGRGSRIVSGAVSLAGSVVALYFTCKLWNEDLSLFNNFYTIDNFGTFFKVLFLEVRWVFHGTSALFSLCNDIYLPLTEYKVYIF